MLLDREGWLHTFYQDPFGEMGQESLTEEAEQERERKQRLPGVDL